VTATLHLLCGKIAAGKSTLAAELAQQPDTVLISEDFWMATLYPGEVKTIDDYSTYSARLCAAMAPHIVQLLKSGLSVVLDFQANTRSRRAWMRGIVDQSGAAHQLHHLDMSDEVCRARLHKRNASGIHEYAVTDAEFDQFTRYFVAPGPDEGFDVVVHRVT
jgi:predicted kinase